MARAAYERFTCECGVPCVMVPYEKSGKLAPITTEPQENGNIVLIQATDNGPNYTYRIVPPAEREEYPDVPRYLNHWANCGGPSFQRRKP
jgi:hypothetical protein